MALKPQVTIVLLALLLGQAALAAAAQITNESSELAAHTSILRPAVERVFSRKRRFLFLPPGASVKFTMQLSKHLISRFPRGFNFVIEVATYYPTPITRADLVPKRLRPTTPAPAPKPVGPTPPLLVYIPGTDLRYKARPALKPKPVKLHRIDEAGQLQWIDSAKTASRLGANKWATKADWGEQKWSKYAQPGYGTQYVWAPQKQAQYQWQASPAQRRKWTQWASTKRPEAYYSPRPNRWWNASSPASADEWPRRERWGRETHRPWTMEVEAAGIEHPDQIDCELRHFADLEPHKDWSHYHSHRDRRQLFHQLEGLSKLLGIDMKTCIMRAICDGKRFLLPPGYSLIQDLLRVVFHFPTISGLTDDYSRIMADDFEECDRRLHQSTPPCPLSILHWLSGDKKTP